MYALCEIQELAYQRDCDRSQGNLLQLLEFSISYNAIQSRYLQQKISGAPYHSIVAHMPKMYRYI